jgi:metallophosphoesterase (TIGR03768 family)
VPAASPFLYPYQVSEYAQYGYGDWDFGPGSAIEKRLDLMPDGYTSGTNESRLLNFVAFADTHMTDKETPAGALYFGYALHYIGSAYTPVMLYTTHVLDAAVQTVNALHTKSPFDFGIFLGDLINNQQYNELRWFIDVLDGKVINPDSGDKDDPVPGPLNDYQDIYKAVGLNKDIPWYVTIGNHDRFWQGFLIADDDLTQNHTGENILNLGNIIVDSLGPNPLGPATRGYYLGSIDGRTVFGDIIGAGPQEDFAEPPKVLAADPNRRPVSRPEFISEFFETTSNPIGHGFAQTNIDNNFASYSFEPKSNIPIKIIVLDTTQGDDEPNVRCYAHMSLDEARYNWLVNELDEGQAEDKLMIIAAHGPIGMAFTAGAGDIWTGWDTNAFINMPGLLAKLHEYPNLIAWIAGHRHESTITAEVSPDPARPELGFWVIQSFSLKHFPQQFRTMEIVRNSDNNVSIIAINVDPAVKAGSPAAESRHYAIAHWQIHSSDKKPWGTTGEQWDHRSYNAELLVPLSPEMKTKIAAVLP